MSRTAYSSDYRHFQVKVWFQNRRTKYKRQKIEEKAAGKKQKDSNIPDNMEELDEIELDEEDEAAIDREEEEYERMRLLNENINSETYPTETGGLAMRGLSER